ncbi:hypothetical protein [Pistricoccus aurantiacus]|uniref:hypothetical protein n=1 Tax=Pistricoccus aurantiacus TaxID=1883414 RepID=UPI0036323EFC
MAFTDLPVARSPKRFKLQMLQANRFLGLHQAWLGLLLSPGLFMLSKVFNEDWQWWWMLPAFLAAWGIVELLFLPRRLVIHRLAVEESRAEVIRLAWQHGVSLRDIKLVDHEP